MVLMRTAPQFSHKYSGKLVVLLRTAARFSQKYFFKKHPSDLINWRLSGQSEANRALDLLLQRYHRRVLERLFKGGQWTISALLQNMQK